MAQKVLEYTIHLTNKAQVDALQAAYPGGIHLAPDDAAAAYLAPKQMVGSTFAAPCVRSGWFVVNGSNNYPTNVASFSRKSGGWFGLSFLFGTTTVFKWVGIFAYSSGTTPEIGGVAQEVVAIAQRKWIHGFELAASGDVANQGSDQMLVSREASRHASGYGWTMRGGSDDITVTTNVFGAPQTAQTWERIYIRVRQAPAAAHRIFYYHTSAGANWGASIYLTPDRRLIVNNVDGVGTEFLIGTGGTQLPLNTWVRLDVLLDIKRPGGNIEIFLNRKSELTATSPDGTGLSATVGAVHTSTVLGWPVNGTIEADFDDWMGAVWPTLSSGGKRTGIDWLNGSKIEGMRSSGAGTGNAWAGDYRGLNGQVLETSFGAMTSAVDAAALVLNVDMDRLIQLGAIGPVCFVTEHNLTPTGVISGAAGTVGWRFNGLLDLAAITQSGNTNNTHRRMYRPAGLTVPIANLSPLELHHIKISNGNTETCFNAGVAVELVGTFGAEDIPADEPTQPDAYPPRNGVHMMPYPKTAWALNRVQAIAPLVIHSGVFTGNGTQQELQFRVAPTWFMVKRTSGAATGEGVFWFSSQLGSHIAGQQGPSGTFVARVDPSFVPTGVEDSQEQRFIVRIAGATAQQNGNTNTYNYVAFCDPAGRFNLNGVFHHNTADAGPRANALQSAVFTPLYAFLQRYRVIADATIGLFVRGPGHTTQNGSPVNTVESANVATLAAGVINSYATIHGDDRPTAYAAFRNDDGSADPNKNKIIRIGTYTGDGAASRTIGFAPSGLRPLYALVTPHNATSIHRSPGSTGTNSSLVSGGTETTTGITAGGIDSMTVGVTLNANGVIYEYFVLLGSATAGNGGWSIDGEFSYLDPNFNFDGGAPDTSIEPIVTVPTDPSPDPGPDDADDCSAGDVCVAATTREVNRALLEIGNTKFLTNYCTQNTVEAVTAQLLYEVSVRAVLHDFPWPFATRYAMLALAVTQPTNQDWAYSYRQPVDCVFERRLVVDRGPGVDPKGPPFKLSSDSSGGLILTNEPNAVLEYTARPACVAFTGDALFKEALKWHLAAALAPPLTRMADKAKMCREQYDLAIAKANAVIKPGMPGLRDAADPASPDAAAECIAANLNVINLALLRIGANTIANLTTEQSREATAARLIFEHELRATLREYPWKFAKRYNSALALVGGTSSTPVNPDWQYSYRLPADYVSVRRLPTTGTGRSFEREPKHFEVTSDATGYLLLTSELTPNLEYTARIGCAVARADDLFRDALAWKLASSLAPSLAQVDPEREEQYARGPEFPPDPTQRVSHKPNKAAMRDRAAQRAFTMYLRVIEKARVADANESDAEPEGEAEWIEGR